MVNLDLLKALLKNGLKICPKKCQLFKTELQYMGTIIFIKDRKFRVEPLRSRLKAIQNFTANNTKNLQKFSRNSKLSKYDLPRVIKIT